jgi:hypothetical protein
MSGMSIAYADHTVIGARYTDLGAFEDDRVAMTSRQ